MDHVARYRAHYNTSILSKLSNNMQFGAFADIQYIWPKGMMIF